MIPYVYHATYISSHMTTFIPIDISLSHITYFHPVECRVSKPVRWKGYMRLRKRDGNFKYIATFFPLTG